MLENCEVTPRKLMLWDYFVVLIFLFTSGATFWVGRFSAAVTFLLFLFVALFNSMHVKHDFLKISNPSIVFIYCVVLLCLLNYAFFMPEYQDNSMVGYVVCLIGAYMVISRYDFFYFRKLLTDVVFALSMIGMPVYLLSEMEVLPTQSLMTQSGTEYTMFYIYTLGWPNLFHRFTCIWHEAGACQIILNTVLWLHFDNIVNWKWKKGLMFKIIVIFLATLLTMSTGAYMVIMLLFMAVVMNLKIKSNHKIIIFLVVLLLSTTTVYIMINSPVVQNKLFDAEGENVSKLERLSDIFALWNMTLERPLLGYGVGSVEFWQKSDEYGNTACSTGLLTYSASLGFTWLLVFVFFLWKGISRLNLGKASIFLIIAVLLMQFNEKFIEYPITNLFIFKFASYFNDNDYGEVLEDQCSDSYL